MFLSPPPKMLGAIRGPIPSKLTTRTSEVSRRAHEWAERQNPGSASGVAISAWRHYRDVDGPLQSALLSLYMLIAVLPAVLVMEEYLDPHPNSLANSIAHHFNLSASTGAVLHSVLQQGRSHELGSALFAIAGALIFGVGFGRVLQLVYRRAWNLRLPPRQTDQALYGLVLLGLYGLLLLLLVQVSELKGEPQWVGLTLAVGWVGLLLLFFVWTPWLLTRKLISRRDLLPSAALTAVALVALMVITRFVMQFWVDLYARDYGGLGVVLAIYFWLAIGSAVIVWSASLSPALAERREVRHGATTPVTKTGSRAT